MEPLPDRVYYRYLAYLVFADLYPLYAFGVWVFVVMDTPGGQVLRREAYVAYPLLGTGIIYSLSAIICLLIAIRFGIKMLQGSRYRSGRMILARSVTLPSIILLIWFISVML